VALVALFPVSRLHQIITLVVLGANNGSIGCFINLFYAFEINESKRNKGGMKIYGTSE
jgi:hypothetical protein